MIIIVVVSRIYTLTSFVSQKPFTSKAPQRMYIVCTPYIPLYRSRDTSLRLTTYCINMKITKRNVEIKYMQKVTVAELKAMPVIWTSIRQWECFVCLIAATNCNEQQALDKV